MAGGVGAGPARAEAWVASRAFVLGAATTFALLAADRAIADAEAGALGAGVALADVWVDAPARAQAFSMRPILHAGIGPATPARAMSDGPVVLAAAAICGVAAFHALQALRTIARTTPKSARGGSFLASAALRAHARGLLRFALVCVFAWAAGGKGFGTETAVVLALKTAFGRARPCAVAAWPGVAGISGSGCGTEASLAFPSGHTNGATFFAGSLLALLLPHALRSHLRAAGKGVRKGKGKPARGSWSATAVAWVAACVEGWGGLAWVGMAAMTAAGRVAADKHWASDTVAGAALGVLLVCAQCALARFAERHIGIAEDDSQRIAKAAGAED